jgi:diadenosine tetraphosphate (Ap4A) HIT family hydrolase
MSNESCLFCRIASGELKVEPLVETDRVIGLLNAMEPFSRGHCVFFPRAHAPALHEMNGDDLRDLVSTVQRVAKALGAENYNLLQNNGALAGQTVFHAHFHLIPKWSDDEGLVYRRQPLHGLDQEEISRRLKEALAQP